MPSAAFHCAAGARRCNCAAQRLIGSDMKAATARGIDGTMPVERFADLPALPA
jgi:hypothetical protein